MKNFRFYVLALLFLAFAGCRTREAEIAPPKRYAAGGEFHSLPLKYRATGKVLRATTSDGAEFRIMPGKTLVFQDCKIALPEPVTIDSSGVYHAGEKDLQIIRGLIRNRNARHFGRKILVDPGHGGKDTGAKGAKYLEKDLNLKLARAIATTLCERGFRAELSRADDRFYSLAERVEMAKKYDLFLSVHHNAALSPLPEGIETFAPESFRPKQMESLYLAFLVQRSVVRAVKETDRGVKSRRLFVLEKTAIPAVLLEAGFVSNPAEESRLDDESRRRKIADAVADAMVDFYCGTEKR